MRKRLLGQGGPLGVFAEYPILLRLAAISLCAETAWATLLIILQYHFKDDLLVGEPKQYVASRVASAALAFTACETILKVPMGALSDRIGPRPLIFIALTVAAITPIGMMLAAQWQYFIPLRACDGFAAAALWPAMSALMARSVPRHAKAAAMSVFNGAYCLGLAIGPTLGLVLANLLTSQYHIQGNRYVFGLCTLFMVAGLVIALLVLRGGVGGKPTADPDAKTSHIGEDFPVHEGSILKGRPLLLRMMVLYAVSQSAVGLLYVMPIYLDHQFKIQEGDLWKIIVIPAVMVALVALPLGRVADNIGRPRAVWISYALATVGMALISITSIPRPHQLQNYLLKVRDIRESATLVATLRDGSDPLARYLFPKLSPEVRRQVRAYSGPAVPTPELKRALVDDLNQLIPVESIYSSNRFAGVRLKHTTTELLAQTPQGEDLIRLNRTLLHEAYPQVIAKNRFSPAWMLMLFVFGVGMMLMVASYILGTPAWLGLTSVQVDDSRQAHALSLMQTAQGVGVNIGLGIVASGGYLLTEYHKVKIYIQSTMPHLPHMSLPKLHLPFGHHTTAPSVPETVTIVPKLVDTVPINVWLYVATAIFAVCLVGTFFLVHEPEHSAHAEEEAARNKQPLEITGV